MRALLPRSARTRTPARPPATDLTRFYLVVSTGGLIGGLLVALVAPLVFNDIDEYPIALAAVAVLLPATPILIGRAHRLAGAAALVLMVTGFAIALDLDGNGGEGIPTHRAGMYTYLAGAAILTTLLVRLLMAHPAWLGAIVAITFFAPGLSGRDTIEIAQERTFFGVYRVEEADGVRSLYHGTTLHGAEWHRADRTIESRTTYFAEGSPYADILDALHRRGPPMVIGIAGLGTGSLACYAHAGDTVRIYEIDPVMVELARTHFAALGTCAPDATIVIGDARLALEAETATFDVLALDAFSSDAIPRAHAHRAGAAKLPPHPRPRRRDRRAHHEPAPQPRAPARSAHSTARAGRAHQGPRAARPGRTTSPGAANDHGRYCEKRGRARRARTRRGLAPARIGRKGPRVDRRLREHRPAAAVNRCATQAVKTGGLCLKSLIVRRAVWQTPPGQCW